MSELRTITIDDMDGFTFCFENVVDAFVFDQQKSELPNFRAVGSAQMKAVDLIVELPDQYFFIEVKDFHHPGHYTASENLKVLKTKLIGKFRDTFLYRWAQDRLDKPVVFIFLVTWKPCTEEAMCLSLQQELSRTLPAGKIENRCSPDSSWKRPIAMSCVVVNPDLWNKKFPRWRVERTPEKS